MRSRQHNPQQTNLYSWVHDMRTFYESQAAGVDFVGAGFLFKGHRRRDLPFGTGKRPHGYMACLGSGTLVLALGFLKFASILAPPGSP